MSDEQRDAMAWLECAITIAEAQKFGRADSDKHRATIKSMLAGPRLPEEWPIGAIEAMRNAIAESQRGPYLTAEAAYRALCAFLTAPRTKEVEVEWWGVMRRDHTIDGVYACEANAKHHASGFGYTVVRLTGKATVPA